MNATMLFCTEVPAESPATRMPRLHDSSTVLPVTAVSWDPVTAMPPLGPTGMSLPATVVAMLPSTRIDGPYTLNLLRVTMTWLDPPVTCTPPAPGGRSAVLFDVR